MNNEKNNEYLVDFPKINKQIQAINNKQIELEECVGNVDILVNKKIDLVNKKLDGVINILSKFFRQKAGCE